MKSIRLAEYNELKLISQLMFNIFEEKMKDRYSIQGVENFKMQIKLTSLQKRFLADNIFYIYVQDGNIKGVLELERPCHIAFLFSKEPLKGIAKSLCLSALNETHEEICTVGAFKDAIGFYEKMGFVKISEEELIHEMPFTLMAQKT